MSTDEKSSNYSFILGSMILWTTIAIVCALNLFTLTRLNRGASLKMFIVTLIILGIYCIAIYWFDLYNDTRTLGSEVTIAFVPFGGFFLKLTLLFTFITGAYGLDEGVKITAQYEKGEKSDRENKPDEITDEFKYLKKWQIDFLKYSSLSIMLLSLLSFITLLTIGEIDNPIFRKLTYTLTDTSYAREKKVRKMISMVEQIENPAYLKSFKKILGKNDNEQIEVEDLIKASPKTWKQLKLEYNNLKTVGRLSKEAALQKEQREAERREQEADAKAALQKQKEEAEAALQKQKEEAEAALQKQKEEAEAALQKQKEEAALQKQKEEAEAALQKQKEEAERRQLAALQKQKEEAENAQMKEIRQRLNIRQPPASSNKPTESNIKPGASSNKPTESNIKPGASSNKPPAKRNKK